MKGMILMIDAQSYLMQVELCNTHINNLLDELQRLKALTLRITTALKQDVVSHSGNQDKMAEAVAKIVDLESEINDSVDAYIDKRREVSNTIAKINKADQICVLHKLYFENKSWVEIAAEMHMSERNAQYIHGRALQSVRRILREEAEKTTKVFA